MDEDTLDFTKEQREERNFDLLALRGRLGVREPRSESLDLLEAGELLLAAIRAYNVKTGQKVAVTVKDNIKYYYHGSEPF